MSRANPRFRRFNPLPPSPSGTSVVQIAVIGSLEGQLIVNDLTYTTPSAPITGANIDDLLIAWSAQVDTTWLAAHSSDYQINFLRGTCLTQPTLAPHLLSAPFPANGTAPAGHEPTTVAAVISKGTALRGQHGRGRVYLSAVPTGWVTNSTITLPAGLTAYRTLATALLATVTGGTLVWSPCVPVFSKTTPRAFLGDTIQSTATLRTILGTVRKRRLGRGK